MAFGFGLMIGKCRMIPTGCEMEVQFILCSSPSIPAYLICDFVLSQKHGNDLPHTCLVALRTMLPNDFHAQYDEN
jgi:hypothetical protein